MTVARHPFEYQPPTAAHIEQIARVRAATKALFAEVEDMPHSAQWTLAIRRLEEFSMWINKAIVFDGEHYL
jgi:hypothetical protein